MVDRRGFIARSGLALGAVAVPGAWGIAPTEGERIKSIGLQLYTVRHAMEADLEGTLGRVAAVGYREVEFAGLMGRKAADVRRVLGHLGLTTPAMHVPFGAMDSNWDATLADARALGCAFVVVPSIPDELRSSLDSYRRVAERFNRAAEAAAAAGLRFAYHNHATDFAPLDRRVPFDVLLEATDPNRVAIELDLYWIFRAGHDPLRYFNRWPGRVRLVHVKDSGTGPDYKMSDVGAGIIDWPHVLAAARAAGTEHFIVEHDEASDPFASSAASLRYLSDLKLATVARSRKRIKQSLARWTAKDVPLPELCRRLKPIGYDAIDLLYPDEWGPARAAGHRATPAPVRSPGYTGGRRSCAAARGCRRRRPA